MAIETALLRGRKRASYATQFRILSGRAFKNLYRDPALLAAHYLSSVGLACEFGFLSVFFPLVRFGCDGELMDACTLYIVICGLFFHNVT